MLLPLLGLLLGDLVGRDSLLILLVENDGQLHFLMVADNGKLGLVPGAVGRHGGGQGRGGVHHGIIHRNDDIPLLQTRLLGCRTGGHTGNIRTGRHSVRLCILGDRLHLDTHIGLTGNVAVLDEIGENVLHIVNGNSKTQSLQGGSGSCGSTILCGGDTYHLTVAVEHRAAGVAGVDHTVGLEHVHGAHGGSDQTIQRGDQTVGEGVGQLTQRIANCHNSLTHSQLIGITQNHRLQATGIDLQHRHIVALLSTHQSGRITLAVLEGNGDGDIRAVRNLLHNMVVGDDIAVLTEHKSGAGGGGGTGIAENIGGCSGNGNAHTGGHVGIIELLGGQELSADRVGSLIGRPLALIHHGGAAAAQTVVQGCTASTCSTAYQGTGQQQGNTLAAKSLARGSGLDSLPGLVRIVILPKSPLIALILAIIKIEIMIVLIHVQHSLRLYDLVFAANIVPPNYEKIVKK